MHISILVFTVHVFKIDAELHKHFRHSFRIPDKLKRGSAKTKTRKIHKWSPVTFVEKVSEFLKLSSSEANSEANSGTSAPYIDASIIPSDFSGPMPL